MGIFFNSLKRQVGRDTGKVISNSLFGDNHSTPHKIIRQNLVEEKSRILELRQQDLETKDLYLLDGAVISAVDQIVALEIVSEIEIISVSQSLEIQLTVNNWLPVYKGEKATIRNKYPDAVLKKFEQCILELNYLTPNHPRLVLMRKTLKKYHYKKFIQKNTFYLVVGLFLIMISCFIAFN